MFESFLQDIRIAFRVLIKEKSFCFLAVLVLALGICGVTTQFTVVNALVLRGFSFPHPEQLMSVGLIDPGVGSQPASGEPLPPIGIRATPATQYCASGRTKPLT